MAAIVVQSPPSLDEKIMIFGVIQHRVFYFSYFSLVSSYFFLFLLFLLPAELFTGVLFIHEISTGYGLKEHIFLVF